MNLRLEVTDNVKYLILLGYPVREIAEKVGMTIGAVRWQLAGLGLSNNRALIAKRREIFQHVREVVLGVADREAKKRIGEWLGGSLGVE